MNTPVVSVIIRTIGRPSLARSILAALSQSWRPLEIVIVRAGGDLLPEFRRDPDVPVRIVGSGSLNRPQAANAGLAAARGDWLVFLDDDDEIAPTHVETLLAAALDSDSLVAYSATSCIGANGEVQGVIGEPFDREALFRHNYVQLGAALFARTLVTDGCRFDEAFECLQDWDFWIQLSARTHFAFTGLPTNRWWTESGTSGAGRGRNRDARTVERFMQMLERKWKVWATWIHHEAAHHRHLARVAAAQGKEDQARAHLHAAERLVRGPVPAIRATKRRWGRPSSSAYREGHSR